MNLITFFKRFFMKSIYIFLVLMSSFSITYGQNSSFEITPLKGRKMDESSLSRTSIPLPTRSAALINLPFVEDFSYNTTFPDPDLWLDRKVYVNNDMALNPPSIGVATFDGIDALGRPYGNDGSYGSADTLTSNLINLKDFLDANGVKKNLSVSDNVVMSFFLQPKGICYAPTTKDSIVLEFRDAAGTWNYIKGYAGIPDSSLRKNPLDTIFPFTYRAILINESKYFNDKFQFRFRNYGRLGGAYEQWHLDFIKIAPSRDVNAKNLDDLAFVEKPQPILKRYTSMPWKHAQPQLATEIQDTFNAKFYNHFTSTRNPTNTNVRVIASNGVSALSTLTIADGFNVKAGEVVGSATKRFPASVLTQLAAISANTPKLTITTEYSLIIDAQEGKDLKKVAIRNDVTSIKTVFDNYFAYDDGTAEMQFSATGEDIQTAVRFKTNVVDTLRGVMFAFPFINGNAPKDALFTLRIFKDSLSSKTMIYERKNINPYYLTNAVDSVQGFTTYKLTGKVAKDTSIVLPAGDFYVSWQPLGDVKIPIGLDRNNRNKSQYLYQYLNGTWSQTKDPKGVGYGAVMVRPIFGTQKVVESSPVKESLLSEIMSIYPNPTQDKLFIDLKQGVSENYEISVFNLTGMLQKREILRGGQIELVGLNTGIYFLKIRDLTNNRIFNHKFAVQK
jgi:hypothetical protein